jgi:hypothetical protein
MSDNSSDWISQAMGILGGSKKDGDAAPRKPSAESPAKPLPRPPAPIRESQQPVAPSVEPTNNKDSIDRINRAERVVVKELARYAALHASILEMKYEIEKGANPASLAHRLEESLKNAKVTIK